MIFPSDTDYYKHAIKFTNYKTVKISKFITKIWLNFMYKIIKSFDFNRLMLQP